MKHLMGGDFITPNISYVDETEGLVFEPVVIKNDSGLDFPIYLDFDRDESSVFAAYYTRDPDELSINLEKYISEIANKYGVHPSNGKYVLRLDEDILNQLGIEIYFKNIKVIEINYSLSPGMMGPSVLQLNSQYFITTPLGEIEIDSVCLRDNGEIFIEY